MKKYSTMGKSLVSLLIALLTLMSVQPPALADIVSSEQLAVEQQSQVQRDALKTFFARDDVKSLLMERGVDTTDAQQRVDSLTPGELSALQQQIDSLPAGEGGLGLVIGIIVIFMLLDIAGVTDIFPAI